eukprot:scaffold1019_cov97-Skeletonema_marinoi.AAC.22
MSATRLLSSTTRRSLRQCCCHCSASCCSANNASDLLLHAQSSQLNGITRQLFRKSLTRCSHTSNTPHRSKHSNNTNFLTPGFQPTAITGDNIGFYQGSTFYDGAPPNVLPILNASPILSPGKYVRQSSWSASHHSNKNKTGTKSGTDAALRLVDARREFMSLMNRELLGSQHYSSNNNGNNNHSGSDEVVTDVRKIYALTGHGVPSELLSHLIQVVRGWTTTSSSSAAQSTQTQHSSSSIVQISFQNVHNSTILNRDEIQVIHANGITSNQTENSNHQMLNHGGDWEHDFDLYMVVMDRIASRLASFVLTQPCHHDHSDISSKVDGEAHTNNEATLGSSGSVINPASLKRWNVTMMKGEALPLSLLPMGRQGERQQQQSLMILTVEWVMSKHSRNDCCNIILRLQDDGSTTGLDDGDGESRGREPISLVFDGVYE